VCPGRLRGEADALDTVPQRGQHRLDLEAGKALAGARVRAISQAQLALGISGDAEGIGVRPFPFVAIG
jgi:hypothetical protein